MSTVATQRHVNRVSIQNQENLWSLYPASPRRHQDCISSSNCWYLPADHRWFPFAGSTWTWNSVSLAVTNRSLYFAVRSHRPDPILSIAKYNIAVDMVLRVLECVVFVRCGNTTFPWVSAPAGSMSQSSDGWWRLPPSDYHLSSSASPECHLWPSRSTIPDICYGSHGNTRVNFFGRCKFLQI